jgi:LPS sulfotransferase NodH
MLNLATFAQQDPVTRALPLRDGAEVRLPDGLTYVFLVFTHRTGSFYLADLLTTSGYFNQAQEAFALGPVSAVCRRERIGSFSAYFAAVAGLHARNGCYVVKSTIGQLLMLAWHGVLQRVLPRSRFIVIERMDKLAQVISWSIADQTGDFQAYAEAGAPAKSAPVYDGKDLRERLARLAHDSALTTSFIGLNGLLPLHVGYERLIADPAGTAASVCAFLDRPEVRCDPALVRLRKQATLVNADWRALFLAERAYLPGAL